MSSDDSGRRGRAKRVHRPGEDDEKQEQKRKKKEKEAEEKADNNNDNNDNDDNECCVCLSTIALPHTTPCGHTFCFLCLKGIFVVQNTLQPSAKCPLCRSDLDQDVFNDAKLSVDEWTSKQAPDAYQWMYAGRTGWWMFDSESNDLIEDAYKAFVASPSTASHDVELLVMGQSYIVNFDRMTQEHAVHRHRRRRVRRQAKVDVVDKLLMKRQGSAIRGQAGVKFT